MKPLSAFAVAIVFGVAVAVLLAVDADRRRAAFVAVVVVTGIAAVRALVRWHAAHPAPPAELRRRRRGRWRWWRRRRLVVPNRGGDRVLQLATLTAGDTHRTLRPLVQDVADERLRARGLALDDPGVAALVDPVTWDLIRPDRPAPHDLRTAGISPDAIDRVLTDLERL